MRLEDPSEGKHISRVHTGSCWDYGFLASLLPVCCLGHLIRPLKPLFLWRMRKGILRSRAKSNALWLTDPTTNTAQYPVEWTRGSGQHSLDALSGAILHSVLYPQISFFKPCLSFNLMNLWLYVCLSLEHLILYRN